MNNVGEGGIRTPGTGFIRYGGLANHCLQPLGHLSVLQWFDTKEAGIIRESPLLFQEQSASGLIFMIKKT